MTSPRIQDGLDEPSTGIPIADLEGESIVVDSDANAEKESFPENEPHLKEI